MNDTEILDWMERNSVDIVPPRFNAGRWGVFVPSVDRMIQFDGLGATLREAIHAAIRHQEAQRQSRIDIPVA